MSASEELKIVLLGKTGSGKSSVGNTLLNKNCFTSKCSPLTVTGEVQRANGIVCGRNVTIIDTPGIFDPNRPDKDQEMTSCLKECAPGPHVFLFVFKVERFTPEYIDTAKKMQDSFGKDALKHTVVLFTHGDKLDDQMTIHHHLDLDTSYQTDEKSKTNVFKSFVKSCGNRIHVIDNKYWKSGEGYKNNSFHISQLMKTIDEMVKENEGKHYTNEPLKILARAIEVEVENIKKELEEAGQTDMSVIKQRARERVKKEAWRKLAGVSTGSLLGALLGVVVGASVPFILLAGLFRLGVTKIAMKVKTSKSAAVVVAAGTAAIVVLLAATTWVGAGGIGARASAGIVLGVAGGVLAVAGAVKGGVKGAKAAKSSDNAKEAAKNAAQSVGEEAKKIFQGAWEAPQKLVKPE